MERIEWLTLKFTLPEELLQTRAEVWRKLMEAGSISIEQSTWILPLSDSHFHIFNEISTLISQNNGQVHIQKETLVNDYNPKDIIQAFNDEREDEYAIILCKCEEFCNAVQKEISKDLNEYYFIELKEKEQAYNRLEELYESISSRDFFSANLKKRANEALKYCKRVVDDYKNMIYMKNDIIVSSDTLRTIKVTVKQKPQPISWTVAYH